MLLTKNMECPHHIPNLCGSLPHIVLCLWSSGKWFVLFNFKQWFSIHFYSVNHCNLLLTGSRTQTIILIWNGCGKGCYYLWQIHLLHASVSAGKFFHFYYVSMFQLFLTHFNWLSFPSQSLSSVPYLDTSFWGCCCRRNSWHNMVHSSHLCF